MPVIVLGTAEAASDLLEKRSNIYYSRSGDVMANEILSGGMRGISMPCGPRWRRWRSLQQSALSATSSAQYRPLQTIQSSLLLRDLFTSKDPSEHRSHLSRSVLEDVDYPQDSESDLHLQCPRSFAFRMAAESRLRKTM